MARSTLCTNVQTMYISSSNSSKCDLLTLTPIDAHNYDTVFMNVSSSASDLKLLQLS